MRAFLVALALAGALFPFTAAHAASGVQLAQMARDVTGAVRKQREERRERPRTDERQRRGSKQ